jgi:hypothetical protein
MKLTYQQAYNKIIDAYFKDEIEPFNNSFCFCGNLNDNDYAWRFGDGRYYTIKEYNKMEDALFYGMIEIIPNIMFRSTINKPSDYEDCIFNGMCAALKVLKQIHKDRGENVDEEIPFVKREINSNKELVNN